MTANIDIFYRAARRTFPFMKDYEDIAHEAWIIATRRGYFHKKMIREAARNLKIFSEPMSIDEMISKGVEFPAPPPPAGDERIRRLKDNPKFKNEVEKILAGVKITKAIKNYSKFIKTARRAVAQPGLFQKVR